MLSQGPNNCSALATQDRPGIANTGTWSDSTGTALEGDEVNAVGGDHAKTGDNLGISARTFWLKCTDFGFTIPPTAIIRGVFLEVYRRESDAAMNASDDGIQLIKGGTIQGDDKLSGSEWPTSFAYASYGGSSDLWGLSFIPSDINSSNFGAAIAADFTSFSGGATEEVYIDHVRMTVYYDLPGDFGLF